MDIKQALPVALIILVTSMVLAVFFVVQEGIRNNSVDSDGNVVFTTTAYADQQVNTSAGNVTVVPGVLSNGEQYICFNGTSGAVYTDGTHVELANSPYPESTGILYVLDDAVGRDETVNCSVNHTDFSVAFYQDINNSISNIGEFSDWYDLIVIVFMAMIIISVVVSGIVLFARRGI